jgi:hypothetical protein
MLSPYLILLNRKHWKVACFLLAKRRGHLDWPAKLFSKQADSDMIWKVHSKMYFCRDMSSSSAVSELSRRLQTTRTFMTLSRMKGFAAVTITKHINKVGEVCTENPKK